MAKCRALTGSAVKGLTVGLRTSDQHVSWTKRCCVAAVSKLWLGHQATLFGTGVKAHISTLPRTSRPESVQNYYSFRSCLLSSCQHSVALDFVDYAASRKAFERFHFEFSACDVFVWTNRHAIAMMFVYLSVCLSGTGVDCDHRVHVERGFKFMVGYWIVQCSWHSDTNACPPTLSRLFPVLPAREMGYECGN